MHVLDWTASDSFLKELNELLSIPSVRIPENAPYMPHGYDRPREARLETFGPEWIPKDERWNDLRAWWLCRPGRGNTPNWDIAAGAEIGGRRGLVLCEAKAHATELSCARKVLGAGTNPANHERIAAAIEEAKIGWRASVPEIDISRDSHYQFANRLSFTWKLASLGIPVVLVYLGFIGDTGIPDRKRPFRLDGDWRRAFVKHADDCKASVLFTQERPWFIDGCLTRLICRSREVLQPTPPRDNAAIP